MYMPVMAGTHARRHLFDGNDASFQLFTAADVLKLDGRVDDLKVLSQDMAKLDQDAGTFRRWNVGDGHMASEGVRVRAETPDVQIVHIDYAFDVFHAGTNLMQRNAARRAFEQDVQGLADNIQAGP